MNESDREKYKLKALVKKLKEIEGRGTELVSLYIPGNYPIGKIMEQLNYEYSTAANIKDDTTRKNVQAALAKIINYLKDFKKIPENGLIIFCGNVAKQRGEQDIRLWAIVPPEKSTLKIYRCDSKFYVEPLEEMLEEKKLYGIITIDKGEAAIGLIKGRKLIVLDEMDSWVPRKHHKGGQSARRFERLIDQATKEWLEYVAEKARQYFDKYKDKLQGIIVGGGGMTKQEFLEYLPYYLRNKVIDLVDTGYSDSYGLREALYRAEDKLKQLEIEQERKILNEFFAKLARGSSNIAIGEEEVKKALEAGAVEKILIMEDHPKLAEFLDLAEKYGVDVEIIEGGTSEAEQFRPIGVAAFLYYNPFQ